VANPLRQGKLVTLGLARECSGYQALPGVIDSRRSAGTRDISELRPGRSSTPALCGRRDTKVYNMFAAIFEPTFADGLVNIC